MSLDLDKLEALYRGPDRPTGTIGRDHVLALIGELRATRDRLDAVAEKAKPALLALIQQTSEDEWAAGWYSGIELILWKRGGLHRQLGELAGGWWTWRSAGGHPVGDGPVFEPMAEWLSSLEVQALADPS